MATDPRELIRKAIKAGDTAEVTRLVDKHIDFLNDLPRDDAFGFFEEVRAAGPEFARAYQSGAAGGSEDPTLLNTIFGDPESRVEGGFGPLGGSRAVIKDVATGATKTVQVAPSLLEKAGPLLRKAIQTLFKRKLLIGGAIAAPFGVAAFQGLEEGIAGQSPQSPQAPGSSGPTGTQFQSRGNLPLNVRLQQQARSGQVPTPETPFPEPDPGFAMMIIDHDGSITGTPGSVALVNSKEIGVSADPQVTGFLQGQPDLSPDLLSFALASGIDVSGIQGPARGPLQGRDVRQVLFPESLGNIGVDVPFQIRPTQGTRALTGETIRPTTVSGTQAPISALTGSVEQERRLFTTPSPQEGVDVPAGAQLSPRIFATFQGRTLLEWASVAAQRHNIPLSILYGVIDHESGWNHKAVGDNGNSRGLAQIFQPAWPGIHPNQAFNPIFALEWTAQKLRERFNQFGRWDAAVAAHNSPAAAQHLTNTGSFQNKKSASYVTDVMKRANRSGLASYLFDEGDFTEVSGTGPSFTPFQTPDPAQSREYISGVYQELLGRKPTDNELTAGVEKINTLARSSYNANLRQAKGGESTAVDVQAQFEESVKGLGEFQFHEEVTQQRSFTDYAAGIARLLQEGV